MDEDRIDVNVEAIQALEGDPPSTNFVLFDGGSDLQKCGLLAEEREPDRYHGFWAYDPGIVDEVTEYLRTTYEV